MSVQNVVFDIGNVFVRWAPLEFLQASFPGEEPQRIWEAIRPGWQDLNRGRMSLDEALQGFRKATGLPIEGFRIFSDKVMSQATLFMDTVVLQKRLADAGIPLYCVSDNVLEAVAYYKSTYSFMQLFKGAIISAEVDVLKPSPAIYRHLFDRYRLSPESCVFFDDVLANVEGAQQVGMSAFVFTDAVGCERDLVALGLKF